MRSKVVLAVAAGLAVVAGAIWWSPESEPSVAGLAETLPDERFGEELSEAGVEPSPVAAVEPSAGVDAQYVSERKASTPTRTVLLRGRAIGLAGNIALAEITAMTSEVEGPVAHATVAADGAFEIDVTELLGARSRFKARDVLVDAAHPDAATEHVVVLAREFAGLAPDETRVVPLDIRFQRGMSTVCVVVSAADGPRQDVNVGVFVRAGMALGTRVARGTTDFQGEFRFRAAAADLVAIAYDHPLRPGTALFKCDGRARVEVPILLEPGLTIVGRVEFRGEPMGHASIQARLGGTSIANAFGFAALVWTGSSAEWTSSRGDVDPAGRFEIKGLAPLSYEVRADLFVTASDDPADRRTVTAPASDVLLEPKVARLRVDVFVNGERKTVEFSYESRATSQRGSWASGARSDHDGAVLWLVPGATHEAIFDPDRHRGVPGTDIRTFALPTCQAGDDLTMRIDL